MLKNKDVFIIDSDIKENEVIEVKSLSRVIDSGFLTPSSKDYIDGVFRLGFFGFFCIMFL